MSDKNEAIPRDEVRFKHMLQKRGPLEVMTEAPLGFVPTRTLMSRHRAQLKNSAAIITE